MKLKENMDRFYLDMVTYELAMMNSQNPFDGITYNSMLYLDIIMYTKDCTVSHIAQKLYVAKSAVTLKVKELEKLGIVKKTQSDEDKRVFYLSVEDGVKSRYEKFDENLNSAIVEIKEKYSTQQIDQFCDMLNIFSKHYTKKTISGGQNE